jgi:hypothetical protein
MTTQKKKILFTEIEYLNWEYTFFAVRSPRPEDRKSRCSHEGGLGCSGRLGVRAGGWVGGSGSRHCGGEYVTARLYDYAK